MRVLAALLCLALWAAPAAAQEGRWENLMSAAIAAYRQGDLAEAERQFVAAAREAETFGPKDERLAISLDNLAQVYQVQGNYVAAESLYRRSLEIVGEAAHPSAARSLNNLAELYRAQEKYAEAEPLYRRAIAIWEGVSGADSADLATSLNNLAALYFAQGRYDDVEPLFAGALAIREKALGPDDPEVARGLNNLAELYRARSDYAAAEPLYRRAAA
ncbi:MAG TPA: tetratricopeptide repeat protein, partial [Dongiaceae bacterium]|nr:tetratricopeptide repeat protein [Dongiaceae bacterium]